MKKALFLFLLIILLLAPFILSFCLWSGLPPLVTTHWDFHARPDGWTSRPMALLFLPVLNVMLAGLLLAVPVIDPLKRNITRFRKTYDGFILIVLLYIAAIHFQTLLWSKGLRLDPLIVIAPGLSVVLFFVGLLLAKAEPNWFIGIRTPWTLSNASVWSRTHRLASALFMILGGISLVSILLRPFLFLAVLGLLVLLVAFLVFYSFLLYRSEEKKRDRP